MVDRRADGRRARRLPRGTLTAEQIVSESLRLLDEHGVGGFSLPKLGRALGADPTAFYRHFASKDDLLLAIADRLIEEQLDGLQPSECWVDTLVDVARRLRETYLAHPAAASLSAFRTTRRPAEMHAVDVIIGALLRAGFEGAEAAVVYRAFADFVLSFTGGEASFLSLEPEVQDADRMAWAGAYLTVDPAQYPNTWQIRTALPQVSDDDIFETVLGLVMGGLLRRAPRPCGCSRHATDRAAVDVTLAAGR
ncbi:MAG TPA: TetR/AcrR family transcriptional regulator [Jatrophihabitans sp.]|nr:TetR/AcrR family transcriptional regulator [Jatrophihabitans sp.]